MEHILQDCPEYCEPREKYWPTEVTLSHKLYRTKEELQTMVEFIMGTKLV